MNQVKDNYDRAWEHIMNMATAIKEVGIPDHAIPMALADFLVMSVLAMMHDEGTGDYAVYGIIDRQFNMLNDYRLGNEPFINGFNGNETMNS